MALIRRDFGEGAELEGAPEQRPEHREVRDVHGCRGLADVPEHVYGGVGIGEIVVLVENCGEYLRLHISDWFLICAGTQAYHEDAAAEDTDEDDFSVGERVSGLCYMELAVDVLLDFHFGPYDERHPDRQHHQVR